MSSGKLELILKQYCNLNGLTFVKEYKFCETRKWKADFYIVEKNLLIEYEGLVRSGKGGHQTRTGFSANCDKYNEANLLGFKMLRYTALNIANVIDDLKRI